MTKTAKNPHIDLNLHDRKEVERILKRWVPGYEVWAFGSRAKGTAKPYSDLDLAIISDQPLPLDVMADLRESLDESDLTIKVDVVDWAKTSARFQKIIEAEKVVVQARMKDEDPVSGDEMGRFNE